MKVVIRPRLGDEEDIRVCVTPEAIPSIVEEAQELATLINEDVVVEITVYPEPQS